MQKAVYILIAILFLQNNIIAQVNGIDPALTEKLTQAKANAEKATAEANQKNKEALDLRKQATTKKTAAIKEQNKEAANALKNEATQLEEAAKQKLEEAKVLRKNATEFNKEIADANKLTTPKTKVNLGAVVNTNVIPKLNVTDIIYNENDTWVEIYELPRYQGRKIRISENSNNITVPFPIGTLSIKKCKSPFNVVLSVGNNDFRFSKFTKFSSYGDVFNKVYEDLDSIIYNIRPQTITNLNVYFEPVPFIEVFQFPNYQGKSIKFYTNTKKRNVVLPFNSTNISIKLSNENNTIAYIENTRSEPKIKTLVKSLYSYFIDAKTINFIQVGTKKKLELDFNGVLYSNIRSATSIHNNDCKKLYGNIAYKLIYRGDRQVTELINAATNEVGSSFTIFNKEKGTDYVCPFIYNTNEHPLNSEMAKVRGRTTGNTNGEAYLKTIADLPNAKQIFYIDSLSYCILNTRDLSFRTDVKIGSAHKSCDICTDFTWDAAMKENEHKSQRLPDPTNNVAIPGITGKFINLINVGPFRAVPVQHTKDGNFIGPEHPTYLQFIAKIID